MDEVAVASDGPAGVSPEKGGVPEKGSEATIPAALQSPPKPKERTPDDDFEDLLKKTGGLKYKAAGKEKTASTAAEIRRLLSRVDGTDAAATEAIKERQETAAFKQKVAGLAKLKPLDRIKAIGDLGIDPKIIQEAVEESILEAEAKSKAQAGLSPRERELQAQLEEQQNELATYRTAKEQWDAEQAENQHVANVNETYGRLEKVAVGALQKAKISGEHTPKFLHIIADHLDRNERLGLGHDEGELADVVLKEHESLADQYYGGLEVPALADKLEGVVVPDPNDPKKSTTRLKLLMLECAKRLRASMSNGSPVPVTRQASVAQDNNDSVAEKMRRARTFGGGGF